MFQNDTWAKIWRVTDKGNYAECQITTSKKNKETKQYQQDFSGIVRFVGRAYKLRPQKDQNIKLLNCAVQGTYNKETKKTFYAFIVFDYQLDEYKPADYSAVEEDLPFLVE